MQSNLMLQDKDAGLPPWVSRRLITVDDYYKMADIGILSPQDRLELLEGRIVKMSPIGSEHAGRVSRLNHLLITSLGDRGVLRVHSPVRFDNLTEPEPDFAVVKPRSDHYVASHPAAEDVLLLVEVADSSLAYDRGAKAALYARHAIRECWIVNLKERVVTVYRAPTENGYASVIQVTPREMLSIETLPGWEVQAANIFLE